MSGSSVLPSTAVFARVEPDRDENTVPPTTATTDSRPGMRVTTRSIASMARKARPVWNRISPSSRNSGIGANVNVVSDATALRTSWLTPTFAAEEQERAQQVHAQECEGHGQADAHQHDQRTQQQGQRRAPLHA